MFTRDDLDILINRQSNLSVSIFMPTQEAGPEIRQNPIRLKNLIHEAEAKLEAAGHRRPEWNEILSPAVDLIDETLFWQHQSKGLALFLAKDFHIWHRVPLELEEEVMVGDRFHVKPLLPLLQDNGKFFLLTITAFHVGLYRCDRGSCAKVPVSEMPDSVQEIYDENEYQNMRHSAPVARHNASARNQGPSVPATHNFGESPEESRKAALIEFLRRVDSGIAEALSGQHVPVVLAAPPEIQGNFRGVAHLRTLHAQGLELNPEAFRPEELHAKAVELLKPYLEQGRHKALDDFHSLNGSGRAETRVEEVVKAALEGRVDTLFVARDHHLWGRVDEANLRVYARPASATNGDLDLLDYAAVQTLKTGGRVAALPRSDLPGNALVAAVYRY